MFKYVVGYVIGLIISGLLTFGFVALAYKGISWCFDLTFSWKIAGGIWLVLVLIAAFFKSSSD